MPVITSPAAPFTLPGSTTSTTSSSSIEPLGPILPPSGISTSSLLSSSSSSSPMSTLIATASASADSDAPNTGHSKPASAGLIVGIIILILVVAGAALFFVRRYFILKRGQKMSATRARLSRVIISEPTNFQHLGTGRVNVASGGEGGAAQISGFTVSNHQLPSRENLREEDVVYERDEVPRDKNKRNQSYDFGTLESGLSDHVERMRKNQKAPTRL